MMDFHTTKSAYDKQGQRREAYDNGDSDDESGQPGIHTCRSQ